MIAFDPWTALLVTGAICVLVAFLVLALPVLARKRKR